MLNDKKILISGGTTGIGRATAILLASHGAKVLVFGRHENELNDAMMDINRVAKNRALGLTADSATKDGLDKVFSEVDNNLGGIDVFVNNAALGGGNLFKEDYSMWKYMVETNILGYLSFARYAADRMEKKNEGHIVNIGSLSADGREAESEVYVATKAAVQAFSESLRKAVNPKGIKVSLIEPGAVGTDMQPQTPGEQRNLISKYKMLMAEDIAQAVLYCLIQPKRTDIIVLQIRPHLQAI